MKFVKLHFAALWIYVICVAPQACKNSTKISGSIKERQGTEAAEKEKQDEDQTQTPELVDEAPSIPTVITGTLLTCSTVESNDKIEISVGCRYVDDKNLRVPLSALAKEQVISYSGTLPSGIVVTQLPASAEYETNFIFQGSDFATLLAVSRSLRYLAHLKDLLNGGPDGIISGNGNEIITAPAPRWVRDSGTDTNKNGLCDGSELCVYIGNGWKWVRDGASPRNHIDASLTCQSFSYAYKDWRLPSTDMMKMAFAKGIWELAGPSMLNLSDSNYYSSQGPIPGQQPPEPTGTIYTVNFKSGVQTSVIGNVLLRTVCVTPDS